LGGDRWAELSRRAAARKVIDYATFDPHDPIHLAAEELALDGLEGEFWADHHEQKRSYYTQLASGGDADVRKQYADLAAGELYARGRLLAPYIEWPKAPGKIDKEEFVQLQQEWEAQFGRLSDPTIAAKLKIYEKLAQQPIMAPPDAERV